MAVLIIINQDRLIHDDEFFVEQGGNNLMRILCLKHILLETHWHILRTIFA